MGALDSVVVASLEARRRVEMASLISRQGGIPYEAPALREVPLENGDEVTAFINRFLAEPVAALVCLTGVGTRALLQAAAAQDVLEPILNKLASTTVVARGPKPVAVLREYNVRIDLVPPEPNTSREVLELLRPLELRGKLIAMQHYGEPNQFLREALIAEGAQVLEVSLYRWSLPEDTTPLVRFLTDVQQGGIQIVAANSKTQVHNLFAVAEQQGVNDGLRDILNQSVVVAAVGPVCAQAWRDNGVAVDVVPEHPHMGHLVHAIADYWAEHGAKAAGASSKAHS